MHNMMTAFIRNPKNQKPIIVPTLEPYDIVKGKGKEKFCGQCRRYLPIEQFNKNRCRSDGHQANCKECQRATVRRYRERNRIKNQIK